VDFARRQEALREVRDKISKAGTDLAPLVKQLLDCTAEGRVKLYLIHRLLTLRRAHPELFLTGGYEPLETLNEPAPLLAFVRHTADAALTVAAPIRVVRLLQGEEKAPLGDVWREGQLLLPRSIGPGRWRNVCTGEMLTALANGGPVSLSLKQVFRTFPVAVLLQEREDAAKLQP
jgi:(1->4)-alpha-D-glucan 1-alpha-D-glucosylmutase